MVRFNGPSKETLMDFTFAAYDRLLDRIGSMGRPAFRFDRWLAAGRPSGCILRHDVDRTPANALRVAAREHARGVHATYYFRTHRPSFNPTIIKAVADLGHEIGYHYENLADCRGDLAAARSDFERQLERMRALVPVTTICMHGRPLAQWDNRDLWPDREYRTLGIVGDAYLDVDFNAVDYFSDTGRTWHPLRNKRRDRVARPPAFDGTSTADLIAHLNRRPPSHLMIVMHPERWAASLPGWCWHLAVDTAVNLLKTAWPR
jgi:hypothetical protein